MQIKKAVILAYHIDEDKLAKIKMVALPLGIRLYPVPEEEEKLPLGLLAGAADWEPDGMAADGPGLFAESLEDTRPEAMADGDITEPMMILAGVGNALLDEVLVRMRKRKISVGLKAVLTETNASWSGRQVHQELKREREAFLKNKNNTP